MFSLKKNGAWGMVIASRLALILSEGRPAEDVLTEPLQACHTCDNPPCCNPAHLFWGTSAENHEDMCLKGRSLSNLSDGDIREMRRLWDAGLMTQTSMALVFHVDQTTVSRIVLRKTHRHVT